MSSSTLLITPNHSRSSLRRPLPSGDKKSTATDGSDASTASGGDTSKGKDPIHSIKPGSEAVVERSSDAVQTKMNSTTKLRKRTAVKKGNATVKPMWKTVVSVIVKNLGLLVILLLLGKMIGKLVFDHGVIDSVLIPNSDYENRVAEVEKFLKTTTKMMQVQVEVMDMKINKEISGLKSDLSKKIDSENVGILKKFSELDEKVEKMEKSLASEWLSKDEFDNFVNEFKAKKGVDDIGEMKLDEIRAFARDIVEKEIKKHAADGLGRVDYAVASGGAMVLKHSEPFVGASRVSWFTRNVRNDAVKMLQPSFGQPGECFPLKGDNGFVEIKLRTAIVPEAVTLEHVSKSVAFDRSSAPKDCRIIGWLRNEEDTPKEVLLSEFTYDLEKSSAQTYSVLHTQGIIDTIRLEFMSNHGSPTHTCIYRVRVHGHQARDS